MPSNKPNFSLRINEQVLNAIKQIAKEDNRTCNKEIEYILKLYIQNR